MEQGPRPRSPGIVFSVTALVLLVLLATFALTQRQPPPPTIAEFAPQAVENITDAPSDQSSSSGRSGGAGAGGGAALAPTPAPAHAVIDVPRVRKCVGDPPRQIEDPQSPPCVPYWTGDNGGATSQGVTRDEIIVVKPRGDLPTDLLQNFLNKRFEFYGRKIRFIVTGEQGDEAAKRASAVAADDEHGAFASLDSHDDFPYFDELAKRKIVAVTGQSNFGARDMASYHPYVWQYPMANDKLFDELGAWACAKLAGRPPEHGLVAAPERKFAVVLTLEWDAYTDLTSKELEDQLRACGSPAAAVVRYRRDDDISSGASSAIVDFKSKGVTSVICLCHIFTKYQFFLSHASSQAWFPEWIVSTYVMLDANGAIRTFANQTDQTAHMVGVTMRPRQVRIGETPLWQALKESDPDFNEQYAGLQFFFALYQYQPILLLASGIQMAGPRLTPETFAAGLAKTTFPNPNHPLQAGKVGFAGGSHSMTTDAAEWWYSPTAQGPYPDDRQGSICYTNGAQRHSAGNWPSDDTLFEGTCDSGASLE